MCVLRTPDTVVSRWQEKSKATKGRLRHLIDSDSEEEDVDATADTYRTAVEEDGTGVPSGGAEYLPAPEIYRQEPFQPGSTTPDGPRRFMCWNNVGIIQSREEETSCSIDVEFHNAALHR